MARRGRVTAAGRATYFRCLGAMFGSGVPLVDCLRLLSVQSEEAPLRDASRALADQIWGGSTMSAAMGQQPEVFTDLDRRLVRVGETTGGLVEVFRRLADSEERRLALSRHLRQSLTNPLLVGSLCLLVAILIPPVLFRGLLQLVNDAQVPVPWPTMVVQTLSELTLSPLMPLLLLLGLEAARQFRQLWRTDSSLRRRGLAGIGRLPGLGSVVRSAALIRLLHSLEALLAVGVPLVPALQEAFPSCQHDLLEDDLAEGVLRLRQGESLQEALGALPGPLLQGLLTGQESGQMERVLAGVRALYELDLETSLEVFRRGLEPLFMVAVGGLVGFTVIAIMLPMVEVVRTF